LRYYIPHRVDGDPDIVVIYEQYQDDDARCTSGKLALSAITQSRPLSKDLERSVENLAAFFDNRRNFLAKSWRGIPVIPLIEKFRSLSRA